MKENIMLIFLVYAIFESLNIGIETSEHHMPELTDSTIHILYNNNSKAKVS